LLECFPGEGQTRESKGFSRHDGSNGPSRDGNGRKRGSITRTDIFGEGALDGAMDFICRQGLHEGTMEKEKGEQKENFGRGEKTRFYLEGAGTLLR